MSTAASESSTAMASSVSSQDKVLTVSFNQNCTALAMGTDQSYSLFTITQNNATNGNLDYRIKHVVAADKHPFEKVHIIERVFSSPFLAIVSDQSPLSLHMFDINKDTETYRSTFSTKILAVQISPSRVIVCLEKSISIFDLRTLRVLHTIDNIASNPTGLCVVSASKDNPYLAYPGSSVNGGVQIFNIVKLEAGVLIKAHNGPLAAMAFDMKGERIATASNKGTVIRVHSAVDGSRLFEFRRGVRRVATIYSMAFSPDSTFLATSSNTGTIHIFRLVNPAASASEEASTSTGSWGSWVVGVASYLPQSTEVFTQDRSFATVHLPSRELRTTIKMNVFNDKLVLFVAGYDGVVSTYEVNPSDGGECKKVNQHSLFDMSVSVKKELSTSTTLTQSTLGESAGEYPPNVIQNDDKSAPTASTSTTANTAYYSVQSTTTGKAGDSN